MKKLVFMSALSFGLLALQSCKKEESTLTSASDHAVEDVNLPAAQDDHAGHDHGAENTELAPAGPVTTVALAQSHYDFGDVKKGESVEHNYEITNTGTNPLIISRVQPGCGCTAPEYTKDPIMPGQKGKVTLKFDSSSFDGAQHKSAEIYANVENAPIVISFTANVKP